MMPLAVSLGDPAGIGPELIAEAWARRNEESLPPFMAVCGKSALEAAARARSLSVPVKPVNNAEQALATFPVALPVFGSEDGAWTPGQPDDASAALAFVSLIRATGLVLAGEASALVTAPVAKSRLAAIGFTHPGQTEFVAEACGLRGDDAVMMLAGPHLRTVPLTIHVALSLVPGLVTESLIRRKAGIVAAALTRDFGIAAPRLAVAALNPHAGEDGRMGSEDAHIIAPAIESLRTLGLDVTGPHPADALFAPHARDSYDVALCMYHDQALIPIKALDFDEGVNVTLGLPIIRTSPDHGTAFGIAGSGKAHPGAMIAAIRMAGECALRRNAA